MVVIWRPPIDGDAPELCGDFTNSATALGARDLLAIQGNQQVFFWKPKRAAALPCATSLTIHAGGIEAIPSSSAIAGED